MIEVAALTKRYGSTTAVDGLTFTARPGTVTGFLGPNGAGKSTTMRVVVGLERPTSGTTRVAGERYADLPAPLHAVGVSLGGWKLTGSKEHPDTAAAASPMRAARLVTFSATPAG